MLNNALKILSATPPPVHRLWRFKTAKSAQARVNELETQLGLPQSQIDYNLTGANYRIRELEALVAHAAQKTAPTAIAAPADVKTELHGRARFNASCARDSAAKPRAKSHPELHGRDRFTADTRVSASVQTLAALPKSENPEERLTGRELFKATAKRSLQNAKQ